jgi:hypothetical protein
MLKVSKSAGLRPLGVRFPLPAPNINHSINGLAESAAAGGKANSLNSHVSIGHGRLLPNSPFWIVIRKGLSRANSKSSVGQNSCFTWGSLIGTFV